MDAIKFIKAKNKMCQSHNDCSTCPLGELKNKANEYCDSFTKTHAEEAVAVVEKWLIDHPIKTMANDFLEKYPNALLADDGSPQVCVKYLGCKASCLNSTCKECWNRPIE